jgi:DNA-binding NarL/FixJ family response regulator
MPQYNSNGHSTLPGSKNKFNIIIALSKLQRTYPNLPIVILSEKISHALIGGVLSRGVKSYLLKQDELSKELIQAIRSVYKGGMFFSKTITLVFPEIELKKRLIERFSSEIKPLLT